MTGSVPYVKGPKLTSLIPKSPSMSRAAKATLAVTTALCGSVVWFVHHFQRAEKASMHAGVIRDEERSRIKRERQLDFEVQRELEKEFKKSQSVSPVHLAESTAGAGGREPKG